MIYQVTLKNLDGEKCKVEVEVDAHDTNKAMELAEEERGKGWLAVNVKVIS